MAFDSQPGKFVTDPQQVSHTACYLSNIVMLWWKPILITNPEPLIWSYWGDFVDQLNV